MCPASPSALDWRLHAIHSSLRYDSECSASWLSSVLRCHLNRIVSCRRLGVIIWSGWVWYCREGFSSSCWPVSPAGRCSSTQSRSCWLSGRVPVWPGLTHSTHSIIVLFSKTYLNLLIKSVFNTLWLKKMMQVLWNNMSYHLDMWQSHGPKVSVCGVSLTVCDCFSLSQQFVSTLCKNIHACSACEWHIKHVLTVTISNYTVKIAIPLYPGNNF